ncbi:MAG: hypothetical protein R2810_08965 [Flavobacteriales bacterium]
MNKSALMKPFHTAIHLLLILSMACTTPGSNDEEAPRDDQEKTSEPVPEDIQALFLDKSKLLLFASRAVVDSTELYTTRNLFATCFRVDKGGPKVLPDQFEIPWSVFETMVPTHANGWERVVRFHYGLNDPTGELGWSFWFVDPDPVTDTTYALVPTTNEIHMWDGDQVITAPYDDWVQDHQTRANGKTYFAEVEIFRTGDGRSGAWDDVRKGDLNATGDPHACALWWDDQILRMYRDNASQFQGSQGHLKLVLSFTGDLRPKTNGTVRIAHTVTAHLRISDGTNPPRDLVSDATTTGMGELFNRGVDYGTLCPYRCAHIERH